MLELKKITKYYNRKAVFVDADFTADSGEVVLLTGDSGIGKTTLLDIISGIRTFDSGEYYYNKKIIFPENDKEMSAFRNENIGYILQDFTLLEDYSVMENIILPSMYHFKISETEAKQRAEALAVRFNIFDLLNKKVKQISGGQKQRVAIIRSFILNPKIILADEPTTNLDSANFELVVESFKELMQNDKIIIISTHDERLFTIADKIYNIENYKLVEVEKTALV